MKHLPSPNYNTRPRDVEIDTIVIHYTGMKTLEDALCRLCDELAEVSCHYLISISGEVYRMVDEDKRAWHAGVSSWAGRENVNDFSIGIELENKGHEFGYTPFPKAQMDALVALVNDIKTRHNIKHIMGHSDIAPTRKKDPGEFFDWSLIDIA